MNIIQIIAQFCLTERSESNFEIYASDLLYCRPLLTMLILKNKKEHKNKFVYWIHSIYTAQHSDSYLIYFGSPLLALLKRCLNVIWETVISRTIMFPSGTGLVCCSLVKYLILSQHIYFIQFIPDSYVTQWIHTTWMFCM